MWTAEEDALLRQYARTKKSAGMAARKIGRSRSAVLGRAWRLGVRFNAPNPRRLTPPQTPRRRIGRPPMPREIKLTALAALYATGAPYREVCSRIGVSMMSISRWKRDPELVADAKRIAERLTQAA